MRWPWACVYANPTHHPNGDAAFVDNGFRVLARIQQDRDDDGRIDACDNCLTVANANQNNLDGDLLGDACDPCIDPKNSGVCIPTLSEWGLVAMGLLTVAAGTVVVMRRRATA